MAITTLAGMSSGATQEFAYSKVSTSSTGINVPTMTWILGGTPPAGSIGTTLSGTPLDASSTGAFPYKNPPSGNTYLSSFKSNPGTTVSSGQLVVAVDLLWISNNVAEVTTTQTINSATFPNRDRNGSSNGDGVYIGLYHTVSYGSAAAYTATISYTNSLGATGKTGTVSSSGSLSTRIQLFRLDSGDVGVRSIQSFTFSAVPGSSGRSCLFAYRPLAVLCPQPVRGVSVQQATAFSLGAPRIYDSTCLAFFFYGTGNTGSFILSQG